MSNEVEMTLFEPEVVLPVQMSWGARCNGHTSGARALMLAILEDAMLCVERGCRRRHPRTRKLAAEAETWMRSDSREWLFSFASICDVLGMDADALRDRLLTKPERPPNGGEPSTRSRDVARLLPQRGSTRESMAVDTTGVPAQRNGGSRGTGSGLGACTRLEVA